ncbi:hypothetical protein F511_22837 [Dorcoceras hygrometricum]|uniref:Uncharacterized protein n=1 Tax=Dorcoceras hygrometricum TaxID=472368 RepID=A0A2Z7D4D9_9LAMI|nr:hypothetical protein F511_22837 [Dorcoceras hygrometricum]
MIVASPITGRRRVVARTAARGRITDSACKDQLVVVSVQYGPFNSYIPIRSTTIDSIGYPRMRASGESSTTKHRLLHASGPHPILPPNDPKFLDSEYLVESGFRFWCFSEFQLLVAAGGSDVYAKCRVLVNPAELTAGVVAQNSCCYCKRFVQLWGNAGRYSAACCFERDLFSAVGALLHRFELFSGNLDVSSFG